MGFSSTPGEIDFGAFRTTQNAFCDKLLGSIKIHDLADHKVTNPRVEVAGLCLQLRIYNCGVLSDTSVFSDSLLYHRLRGSASPVLTATGFVNGKGQFLTPHRIDIPQPITKKFVTGDYVGDPYGCAKLGAYPSTGGFWAHG